MNLRVRWRLLSAFIVPLLAGPATAAENAKTVERPNIVFILVDDLGWTDSSCYGSTFYETPAIDRLARQGMRFTDAYAACCVCSPTRASILTGKYPARLHVTDWIPGHARPLAKLSVPKWTMYLGHEHTTIADRLRAAGYATAAIGKWHLGGAAYRPETHGFDLNFGGDERGQPPSYFVPYRIPIVKDGPAGEYLTDRLTDEAERFLETNRARPFFLYLAHYAVHTPLMAKQALIEKYRGKIHPGQAQRNAVYAAMIDSVDQSVARITKKLDALGIAGRTIVVYTSDNGGLIGSTSNVPLRAGKGTPWEGGTRVPLIVRWPGVVPPGSQCHVPAISVDFYPTLLAAARVAPDLAEEKNLDGQSLLPLMKQTGPLSRDAVYWHYPHYHPCGATPYGAVRQGDFKLVEFYEDRHVELYNLKDDLSEKHELSVTQPEKARQLQAILQSWRTRVGAQMPTPNPAYDPDRDGSGAKKQRKLVFAEP